MNILALEPYFGGSHKAFLEGWIKYSKHTWTVLSLPPNKWKWRMRHGAITLSKQAEELLNEEKQFDLIICSDMLNLAEFLGLAPDAIRKLPVLVYFHENQLAYPVQHEKEYDYHFAFSNMTTALAAGKVWFNSEFNRDSFLSELEKFLKRMPDHQPLEAIDTIRAKSDIRYPPIDDPRPRTENPSGPIHILWAARWEYDKNPEFFFRALEILHKEKVDFRLSVIGGHGGREPLPVFENARELFKEHIINWGFLESRVDYENVLSSADIAVSTADHEFFGIGMIEAAAAGAYPLVPRRLAYPEVFDGHEEPGKDSFFYEDNEKKLARRLEELATRHAEGDLWQGDPQRAVQIARKYTWTNNIPKWDEELEKMR